MRSVSASLGSLSPPSLSPSPAPPQTDERAVSQTTAGGAGLDSGSELSELTEEEQEAGNCSNDDENEEELDEGEEEDEVDGARLQPTRRGGGRRKRGGMVPAPMWDWAYKQKKAVERGATAPEEEEEEEEEQPSPPKAMEEEEDEDDSEHTSTPPSINGNVVGDEDEKDEDEPWGADYVDLDGVKKIKRPIHVFPQKSAVRRATSHTALHTHSTKSEDGEEDEDEDEDEPDVEEDADVPQLNLDLADPANDSDSDPDLDAPPAGSTVNHTTTISLDMDINRNIDITAPSTAAVAPFTAGASIMAGSSVLASATPSPDSSLSGSPSSSRSVSPVHDRADDEDEDDDDGEDTTHDNNRIVKNQACGDDEDIGALASAASTIDGVKSKFSAKDADVEDLEVASVLHDELDMEIDADLQPAHRAEALDVLATIELKFALLRERVYVEKMEGLAWEEALVAEGTHPEYVYLQTELSRREAKRKELAARQRTYDIALVTRKRKMDENYIWGCWKFARDELQTDMVSEHKRKYRRLERDRRALGQPQPVRLIPTVPREVPPPPTVRQIVKSFPYPGNRLTSKKRDHMSANAKPLVYPELSTLSSADIATDVEYLYQNRRAPFDPHSHRMGMSMSVSGPQLGPATASQHGGYDAYTMNIDGNVNPQYTPGTRMPPPPAPYQQHQHHQILQPFPSSSGRSQHHVSQPPPSASLHNHTQGQFPVESEMTLVNVGPGHGHQYFSGPAPGASLGISRPISPMHLVGGGPGISGLGGKQGAWVGDGRMSAGHHSGGKQGPEYGWMGMHEAAEDRERESKRERERERDKRERSDRERDREQREFERDSYMMSTSQPHRHVPPHQHSHPHNTPAPTSHHHQGPHHHHRHHHHVLHHHHPQQPGNGSGPPVPPLAVPPGSSGPGSVPSPRIAASRDFEPSRPHSGPAHSPEVLSLSTSKPGATPSHWKRDELSSSEYREIRGKHGSRPSSVHPAPGIYEDRDRPLPTPFAMASSQAMSSTSASGLQNGQSVPSAHSPRPPWSDEHGSRLPSSSSSFPGPLGRGSSLGLSPPRSRPPVPRSPSSSLAFPGPMRSPTRYSPAAPGGPDPPVMLSLSSSHGRSASTPTSPGLKTRVLSSPPPTKTGMRYSPPRLSGPGRTSTPTTVGPPVDIHSSTHSAPSNASAFNRTASPLTSFNSSLTQPPLASSRPPPNGNTAMISASKVNAIQVVDGP